MMAQRRFTVVDSFHRRNKGPGIARAAIPKLRRGLPFAGRVRSSRCSNASCAGGSGMDSRCRVSHNRREQGVVALLLLFF